MDTLAGDRHHVFCIADTFQECIVVFVFLGVIASLYHADIASNRLFPGAETVVVTAC